MSGQLIEINYCRHAESNNESCECNSGVKLGLNIVAKRKEQNRTEDR
jgi:hypothetical protein